MLRIIKVYICFNTLSKYMQIQKSAFKNQKPRTPDLIARGDHRKIIYVPVTGIAKEIAIAQKNIYLFVNYGDHYWSRWLTDWKHLNKPKNSKKVPLGCYKRLFKQLSELFQKFWICFWSLLHQNEFELNYSLCYNRATYCLRRDQILMSNCKQLIYHS